MSHKILVVGPAWVGDMVMAQTLFKLIKQRQPQAIIDVMAPAWSLPLLERMPEVHQGMVMPFGHGQLELITRYQLGKSLRASAYTQAIVLPNSFKSAILPYCANIPVRTGWRGEMRYGLLNDMRKLDKQRYPLMIDRFMALGLPAGEALPTDKIVPALYSSAKMQKAVLEKYHLTRTMLPLLVLCPGAEFGPSKRWPESHYADIANAKLAAGWDVWILGSAKDASIADEIMRLTQQRCVNLAGKTQLVDAVDILSQASVVVTNDSGLMHVAAAVNKPLVTIYGSTSTAFTPPLEPRSKVLQLDLACQPCFQRECPLGHHHCMKELEPARVIHAIEELV